MGINNYRERRREIKKGLGYFDQVRHVLQMGIWEVRGTVRIYDWVTSAWEKGWGENEGAEIGAEERVVFE